VCVEGASSTTIASAATRSASAVSSASIVMRSSFASDAACDRAANGSPKRCDV
jgi:hypothetical protein